MERNGGESFPELYALIEEYARGGSEREVMALKVIGGVYLPSCELRGLKDARRIVDDILEKHGYFVPHGRTGAIHPQSIYAVLNVARHSDKEEGRKWGASRLFRIMEALGKRAESGEGYLKHAADAALISASLNQLVGAAQASRSRVSSLN